MTASKVVVVVATIVALVVVAIKYLKNIFYLLEDLKNFQLIPAEVLATVVVEEEC